MSRSTDLKDQIVLAAFEVVGDDLDAEFTSEQLLIEAWQQDQIAWGLRGYEQHYPDSHRIHRELDSRGRDQAGVVALGLLERVGPRTYRLTPKGLALATELKTPSAIRHARLDRRVEAEIRGILEHPTFREWLKDPAHPRSFTDAGYFWGIAPGTPPRVITERIRRIDDWLALGQRALDERGVEEVGEGRGRVLFDRTDVERCREFQATLKSRFASELARLGARA